MDKMLILCYLQCVGKGGMDILLPQHNKHAMKVLKKQK